MKRYLLLKPFLVLLLSFYSASTFSQVEPCGTTGIMNQLFQENPQAKIDLDNLEQQIRMIAQNASNQKSSSTPYTIPCVVHVIHTGQALGATSSALSGSIPNPTDAQIRAAFDAVNADFNKRNNQVRYLGNDSTGIKVCLATKDPNGVTMAGGAINRYNGALASTWTAVGLPSSNATTYAASGVQSSTSNGIDEADLSTLVKWPINKYYNIYIVTEIDGNNGGSGVQGFAYYPPSNISSPDRAIMIPSSFTASSISTFDHEMGHALNLKHTFASTGGSEDYTGAACPTETSCSTDGDFICDIPLHKSMYSTPCQPDNTANSCQASTTFKQFQYNYMNYGGCPNGFSPGQSTRMRAVLVGNTIRANQVSPSNVTACGCDGTNAPYADFLAANTSPCIGVGVQFTDQSPYAPTSWSWSFSPSTVTYTSGTSSTSQNPVVIFNVAGPYNVTLTATNAYGTTTNTKTAYITPITGASLPFVEGFESTTFPPTGWSRVSEDVPTGAAWDVFGRKEWERKTTGGNGASTASAAVNIFEYNVLGSENSTDDLISKPVSLSGATAPQLTFKVAHQNFPNPAYYDTLSVFVSTDCGNTYGPAVYQKSGTNLATQVGNGSNYTTSFMPSTSSHWRTETVNLAAYAGSDIVVKFQTINLYGNNIFIDDINIFNATVASVSIAVTSGSSTICAGSSVTFTATPTNGGTSPTYQWYKNGTIISGATASTYTSATLANNDLIKVVMTSNLAGVTGSPATSNTITMTVNPLPAAAAGSAVSICTGQSTNLGSTTVSGNTYAWSPSATLSSATVSNPTATPASTTTYTLTETKTSTGCAKTNTVVVTVNPLPTANAGTASTICAGQSVNLGTTTVSGNTYAWSPSATLSSASVSNPTATPASTTTYTLTVTKTSTGCVKTNTVIVTVNPAPAANAGSAVAICTGQSTTLGAAAVTGNTYAWSPSATLSSATASNPTATPASTTTYTLTETKTSTGCAKTNTVIVTVNPLPAANTGSAVSICSGQSTNLGATAVSGNTYSWSPSATLSSATASNPTATPTSTTTYTLTETKTSTGCAKTNTVIVTVNPLPTANAGSAATICAGQSVNLGATTVSGNTYAWSPSATLSSATASNPTATPASTTTYTLTVTKTSTGCVKTNTVIVTVNPLPAANAGSAVAICAGQSTNLGASAVTGNTYAWSPSATLSSATASNPMATPTSTTTYTLTVTKTSTGCVKTNTVIVTVNPVDDATFSYSAGTFCKTGSDPVANINGGASGTFTSTPAGLVISNSSTGLIDVSASAANTYTVTFTSNGVCPASSSQTVTIISGQNSAFTYSGPFCKGSSNPLPVFNTGANAGVFSSSPAGLVFANSSTGEIDLNASTTGTYTVTNFIAASNGCASSTSTATVLISEAPVSNISSTINVSCNGGNDGSATVISTGGTQPYSFSWSANGSANSTANGLSAGTYTVTVTDAAGCPTIVPFTISQPTALVITSASNDATAPGVNDGSITASASNGTPAYTYSVDGVNFQSSGIFNGLGAGIYQVSATDANGCTVSIADTISEPFITGMTSVDHYGIRIYPNPSHDYLIIDMESYNSDGLVVEMKNALGQQILNEVITTDHKIMMDKQAKGVYFITITSKDFRITERIIKE